MSEQTKPGRTSSIRIRQEDLKGDCARLNRRLDLMEQAVVQGGVISGGGGGAGGGGGGGGVGVGAPPAPNILSATVTTEYSCPNNDSQYDFLITINIPLTAQFIDHLKKIRVRNNLTNTDMLVLGQPASGWTSPVTVATDLYLQGRSQIDGTATFNCENDDSDVTPLPVVVPFTVRASAVTGFTFAGEVGARFIDRSDSPTRLVSCMIGFNPVLNGDQVPQSVYYLRSLDDGATFTGIGFQPLKKVGDQLLVQSLAPGVDSWWKIAACTGALQAASEPVTAANIATLFPGIKISDRFLVRALELPSATLISTLTVSPGAGGTYPYDTFRTDGSRYWKIPEVTVADDPAVQAADAFFLRVTVEDLGVSHNSVAPEQPFAGDQVSPTGQTNVYGPLMGDYGTNGLTIVRTGNIAYVRFRVYLCNRVDMTSFSFANPLCATLQTGVGGGLGYLDVVVSTDGSVPLMTDAIGPVTGFASVGEVGTRYVIDDQHNQLVYLKVGFVPICPTPQNVTYLISSDNGVSWVWIGWQRMLEQTQQLLVERLAPGDDSLWRVAVVAGAIGGDPRPIVGAELDTLYPGVFRSVSFTVVGLGKPPASAGITATIGASSDVTGADGFSHYYRIPGVIYTDPVDSTDFFVRITVEDYNAGGTSLVEERPYGGTQITGGEHTEQVNISPYSPGVAYVRYRFYTANRNSKGEMDFANRDTNTLQMVSYNGGAPADHYDVPITIPPFITPEPGGAFNVTSVSASEVGPKFQNENQGLHTVIGVIPVIDVGYATPRTVTIWFDFGNGKIVWQGWYALTSVGQVIRIGDPALNSDGTRNSGDIWVPANAAQGNWVCYCKAGRADKGVDPTGSASAHFTVTPVGACVANGTTNAEFLPDPKTGDMITYARWDPGIWHWEYYELTWLPPSLATDPNYWFTLITVQKGATIGGVWKPAPDSEGVNEDPSGLWFGRKHVEVTQIPGIANEQRSVIKKFGARPATWDIPPAQNADMSPNPYRDYRFLLYNVSRLGTDISGSGGAGTYTLQTTAWNGGSYFILTPQPKSGDLDIRAANPATISLPLTGGNGQPLTVSNYDPAIPGSGLGSAFLADDAVKRQHIAEKEVIAEHMAKDAITFANQALAGASVVDVNVKDVSMNKVTYGTSVFAGDVILSRGLNKPVIVLNEGGIYLYGQADASAGTSGLTSKPYTVVQSSGLGLYSGAGQKVLVDSGGVALFSGSGQKMLIDSSAVKIWQNVDDLSKPYLTIDATALTLQHGTNFFKVTSNALGFNDTSNNNIIDMNSSGIAISKGSNKMVITASDLQLQLSGVARVTISTSGITISNGGTSSIEVTSTAATITNGVFNLVTGGVTVNIGPSVVGPAGTFAGIMVKTASTYAITTGSGFFAYGTNGAGGINTELVQLGVVVSSGGQGQTDISWDGIQINANAGNYRSNLDSGALTITGSSNAIKSKIAIDTLMIADLPATYPGAGTKKCWYDAGDFYKVKYAS